MSGQVVGVDTSGSSTFQFQSGGQFQIPGPVPVRGSQNGSGSASDGFAIPINEAVSIAKVIESGKSSSSVHIGATAFLGVDVASTSGSYGSAYGASGATIEGVVSGSPAAGAGLSSGDTITSVGGHAISSPTSLRDVLDESIQGRRCPSHGRTPRTVCHTATVDLGSGPTG